MYPRVDLFPLAWRIHIGVHDHVCDAESGQMVEAGLVGKTSHLPVQLFVERWPDAAITVNGLLPVRCRVEHVGGVVPLRSDDRELCDDEWPGLGGEPAIDGWDSDAVIAHRQRNRRELDDEQSGDDGREPRAAFRRRAGGYTLKPEAGKHGKRDTARIMKRDGPRMKFKPGSQYTNCQIPKGGPTVSQTLTSASNA